MSNQVFPPEQTRNHSFDEVVLPHMDAAFRLARWLMRNEHDAEDVVQEASLRAFRYFQTFTGGNGRAWFLRIVRNTCHGWRGKRVRVPIDLFDEEQHSDEASVDTPETLLLQADTASAIGRAIGDLPDRARQLLVLRELDGLSYREMAEALGLPMGTVMSGLSRARNAFREAVCRQSGRCSDRAVTRARDEKADAAPRDAAFHSGIFDCDRRLRVCSDAFDDCAAQS